MRIPATILAALVLGSCGGGGDSGGGASGPNMSSSSIQLPAEFTIGHGETIHIEYGVSLEFTTLVEDSRCAAGTTCPWEGNGRILLSTETPRVAEVHELNTHAQFVVRRNFDGDNYYVELRRLTPLPGASGPAPVSAYEITVYVGRIPYHVPTGP